jgi:hypothetical protein
VVTNYITDAWNFASPPTTSTNIYQGGGFPTSSFLININKTSLSSLSYGTKFAALGNGSVWTFSDITNSITYTQVGPGVDNTTYYEFSLNYVSGCLLYTSPSPRDES